jgi:hypothetical protein
LILGIQQLETAKNDLSRADMRVLLVHHPPETDWFRVFDMLRQRDIVDRFDFVLHGHEHERHTTFRLGRQHVRISGGSLYHTDHFPIGFNAVRIDLETGRASVFFWRYEETLQKWVRDYESLENGFYELELPWIQERQ